MIEHERCPLCESKLSIINNDLNILDYYCYYDNDDHFYSKRMVGNSISLLKVMVVDKDVKLYLKVLYDEDRSEVWTKSIKNNREQENVRVKLEAIPKIVFNTEDLKNKIKAYLLLS